MEPVFRRSHGSLYQALAHGHIDTGPLRALLVAQRPTGWPLAFAVDASTWSRRAADASPGRGFNYSTSAHTNGRPVVAGWAHQWIAQLGPQADFRTAPVDVARLAPQVSATEVTIGQVTALLDLLPAQAQVPPFVFDAGYDPIVIGDAQAEPDTWPTPGTDLHTHNGARGNIRVRAWPGLHPKLAGRDRWAGLTQPPIVRGSLIHVQVEHLPGPNPGPRPRDAVARWTGLGQPDLDMCSKAYLHRFDIEHTLRVLKGTPEPPRTRYPPLKGTAQPLPQGIDAEGQRHATIRRLRDANPRWLTNPRAVQTRQVLSVIPLDQCRRHWL